MKKVEKIIYFLILPPIQNIKYLLNANVESRYNPSLPDAFWFAQDMHGSSARYKITVFTLCRYVVKSYWKTY